MSWTLRTADLDDLARGAALLGTGGGGDPFVGKMLVTQALGEAGEITILDPEELDDDAWVIPVAQMGAPTVVVEKMPRGTEPELALITLEKHTGRTADATMPMECGGINSMIPLLVAARRGPAGCRRRRDGASLSSARDGNLLGVRDFGESARHGERARRGGDLRHRK